MVERRAARPSDDAFLRTLFASTRPEAAAFPPELRETLLAQQFEGQRRSYLAAYPDAEHELLLLDGEPVGRLWVAWSARACHILDIALLPAFRARGLGGATVRELLERADRAGLPVRAHVARTNLGATRFWTRLGFAETPGGDAVYQYVERASPTTGRA